MGLFCEDRCTLCAYQYLNQTMRPPGGYVPPVWLAELEAGLGKRALGQEKHSWEELKVAMQELAR